MSFATDAQAETGAQWQPQTRREFLRGMAEFAREQPEHRPAALYFRLLELAQSDNPTVKGLLEDFFPLADRLTTEIEAVAWEEERRA